LDGGRIRLELERLYNQRGDFLFESKGGHSLLLGAKGYLASRGHSLEYGWRGSRAKGR
jgi:hypothetical protein